MASSSLFEDYQRKIKVRPGSNRKFGLTLSAALSFFFVYDLLKFSQIHVGVLVLAIVLLNISIFSPQRLQQVNLYWTALGLTMQRIVSPLLFFILFYAAFVPFGLFLRLFKKDSLELRPSKFKNTYWIVNQTGQESTLKDQF